LFGWVNVSRGSPSICPTIDDRKDVEAVDALIRDELSPLYEHVKVVVFDTGRNENDDTESFEECDSVAVICYF
jgi:hypothetical protein